MWLPLTPADTLQCHRYVPLGLRRWFAAEGVASVVELDWWESARHPGTKVDVTLTPAQV